MVKLSLDGSVASRSSGFRLQELQDGDRDSVTSASVYSGYKLRIDAMFEGPRSQIGGYEAKLKEQQVIANTVQARIEKMFAEVSKVEEKKHGCCFPIKYLGSVVLADKVTSLRGLQEPLKELYLDQRPRHAGHIEISDEGLRVNDELKPFQTIAVWSAIQFVLRKTPEGVVEYAFLPLIADPDAVDKGSLFRKLMTTRGTILEAATGLENHPLFAVVMRQRGSSKVLECHGFVCAGAEDAIVIAANLYQALMSSMQRGGSTQRRSSGAQPRSKHGVSYVSLAGSSQAGSQVGGRTRTGDDDIEVVSSERLHVSPEVSTRPNGDATSMPTSTSASASRKPAPVRPPRQKKKSVTSSDSDDLLVEDPEEMRVPPMADVRVRRVASDSCVASMEVADRGDILTKIAIPRSHSFLTPGGALMRYQRPSEPHGHGSPLGFHELFTEFRLQEGLHSLDDILDVIIDADGMSFNDLKPIYKEFLMKLAVTLTKDELYQRSKNIMRRQRKKLERRDKRKTNVKKVFKRTVISKMRPTSPKSNFEFTSVLFPSGNARKKKPAYAVASGNTSRRRHPKSAPRRASRSGEEDADLAGGGDNKRASSGYVSCSECSFDSELCSCRNKCYCTKPSGIPMACRCKGGQCSCKALALPALPCACDTDSCRESDKCYCKNSKNAFEQLRRRGFAASESSNSRPESPEPHKSKKKHSSVKSTKSLEFLQMKPKWDTPPGSVYQKRMDVYESLPAIRQHPSVQPDQRRSCSFDNLGRYRERKVLVVSARDTRGNVIYNKTSETAPHDALSVKKSAEIAALFHEVKFRRDRDPLYHTLEPPPEYFTMRHRKLQGNDMETSLGYLP